MHSFGPRVAVVAATFAMAAAATAASPALAAGLVLNGGFESVTPGPNYFLGGGASLTSWTSGGYIAVYGPGGADTTGANQGGNPIYIWGPNLPGIYSTPNGLTATSPAGGNFVAMDGDQTLNVPITQTISGLNPGQRYDLSFYYAAAQWASSDLQNWNGASATRFEVSIGAATFDTAYLGIASHGFSGWKGQSFAFTATSTSEVLSFLAQSTVYGVPPIGLLDGVSISAPEPGAWMLMLVGLGGLGATTRRTRASRAIAA